MSLHSRSVMKCNINFNMYGSQCQYWLPYWVIVSPQAIMGILLPAMSVRLFLPHTWKLNYFCSTCALILCLWGFQTYSKCGLNYDRIWTLNLHYCHVRNIMASKRLKICVPWKHNNNKEGNNINTYLLYLTSVPNYCEF